LVKKGTFLNQPASAAIAPPHSPSRHDKGKGYRSVPGGAGRRAVRQPAAETAIPASCALSPDSPI